MSFAIALGVLVAGARSMGEPTLEPPENPLPTFVPSLATPTAPPPTVTPLPPPQVPPPDARGILHTTPPIPAQAPSPAVTPTGALWLGLTHASSLRIELHDARVLVPVVVNGRPSEFILDCNAPTAIDASVVTSGSKSDIIQTLQVGDVRLAGLSVVRAPLKRFAETYFGVRAEGILGRELFESYPVQVDYAASTLTIYRTADAEIAARTPNSFLLPLQSAAGALAVSATLDGAYTGPFALMLNSAAELILSPEIAKSIRLARSPPSPVTLLDARPDGELIGHIARARSFSLGSFQLDGPIVGVGSAERIASIGGGILQRFRISVDVPARSIAFTAQPAASSASTYDRSGLTLVMRRGDIIIRAMMSGSPARDAKLLRGDALLEIEGRPLGSIDDVRAAMRGAAGTRLHVKYRRGGRFGSTLLRLRTLL